MLIYLEPWSAPDWLVVKWIFPALLVSKDLFLECLSPHFRRPATKLIKKEGCSYNSVWPYVSLVFFFPVVKHQNPLKIILRKTALKQQIWDLACQCDTTSSQSFETLHF